MSIAKDPTSEGTQSTVVPKARLAHADPAQKTAETEPLPAAVAKRSPEQKSPAEWSYERLILYIKKFEELLDQDHEVAMGFAGGDAGVLRVQGLGYFAPDLLTFYGTDPAGNKTQLVQHVSQLSLMLKAVPKEKDEAVRIGFALAQKLEEDASS